MKGGEKIAKKAKPRAKGEGSISQKSAADNAAQPPATILEDGHSIGGWLEQVIPIGGGLVRVQISGMDCLVDDSLQEKLATLMGQHMTVVRAFGQWGCGAMPE
ncbi:MAG: hypothetical protein WAW52_12570 [Methanothrix sp.]